MTEDKRKTITGDDIIEAMKALGFDNYVEFLLVYLRKYRQSTKGKGGMGGGDMGGMHASGPGRPRNSQHHHSSGGMGDGRKRGREGEEDSEDEDEDDEDDEDEDAHRGKIRR